MLSSSCSETSAFKRDWRTFIGGFVRVIQSWCARLFERESFQKGISSLQDTKLYSEHGGTFQCSFPGRLLIGIARTIALSAVQHLLAGPRIRQDASDWSAMARRCVFQRWGPLDL
jgi:hypothetical protein